MVGEVGGAVDHQPCTVHLTMQVSARTPTSSGWDNLVGFIISQTALSCRGLGGRTRAYDVGGESTCSAAEQMLLLL